MPGMALSYDLKINQGETWSVSFPVLDGANDPLTVDGWTVRAQVRQYPQSVTPIFEWSTAIGNATVAGTTVVLSLAPTDTATWNVDRAVYDLQLSDPDGNVTRLVEGRVFLFAEITR